MSKHLIVFLFVVLIFELTAKPMTMKLRRRAVHKSNNQTLSKMLQLRAVYGQEVSSEQNEAFYETKISVGTPLQTFKVVVSTGFPILWVPGKGCKNNGADGKYCAQNTGLYDLSQSSSAQKLEDFQRGRVVAGNLVSDNFALGDVNCPKKLRHLKSPIVFGSASETQNGDQGILGLSFPNPEKDGKATSVFQQLINDGLVDEPVFTTYFKPCSEKEDCKNAGTLTLGGTDKTSCEEQVLGWASVNTDSKFWEFTLDRMTVKSFSTSKPAKVISNSGFSDIVVPAKILQSIARQTGAKIQANGHYYVKCTQKFDMKLKINKLDYVIPSDFLLFDVGSGSCRLMISTNGSGEMDLWTLGLPFARSYCQIHQWEKRQIGFAKIKTT